MPKLSQVVALLMFLSPTPGVAHDRSHNGRQSEIGQHLQPGNNKTFEEKMQMYSQEKKAKQLHDQSNSQAKQDRSRSRTVQVQHNGRNLHDRGHDSKLLVSRGVLEDRSRPRTVEVQHNARNGHDSKLLVSHGVLKVGLVQPPNSLETFNVKTKKGQDSSSQDIHQFPLDVPETDPVEHTCINSADFTSDEGGRINTCSNYAYDFTGEGGSLYNFCGQDALCNTCCHSCGSHPQCHGHTHDVCEDSGEWAGFAPTPEQVEHGIQATHGCADYAPLYDDITGAQTNENHDYCAEDGACGHCCHSCGGSRGCHTMCSQITCPDHEHHVTDAHTTAVPADGDVHHHCCEADSYAVEHEGDSYPLDEPLPVPASHVGFCSQIHPEVTAHDDLDFRGYEDAHCAEYLHGGASHGYCEDDNACGHCCYSCAGQCPTYYEEAENTASDCAVEILTHDECIQALESLEEMSHHGVHHHGDLDHIHDSVTRDHLPGVCSLGPEEEHEGSVIRAGHWDPEATREAEPGFHRICRHNLCTCMFGEAATGEACHEDGHEVCHSCHGNYHVEAYQDQRRCLPTTTGNDDGSLAGGKNTWRQPREKKVDTRKAVPQRRQGTKGAIKSRAKKAQLKPQAKLMRTHKH